MKPGAGSGADGRPPRVVRPSGEGEEAAPGVGLMGMAIFIASLSMLFGAGIVAYVIVRARADTWRPPGDPGPPFSLWISTVLLLGCGIALQRSLTAIRAGRQDLLLRRLSTGLGLAGAFLVSQSWSWYRFYQADVLFGNSLYGFTFYMLTGLHALHIVGGVVSLVVVIVLARRGTYSWAFYPGVRLNVVYWHFLSVVWLVLLALLVVG